MLLLSALLWKWNPKPQQIHPRSLPPHLPQMKQARPIFTPDILYTIESGFLIITCFQYTYIQNADLLLAIDWSAGIIYIHWVNTPFQQTWLNWTTPEHWRYVWVLFCAVPISHFFCPAHVLQMKSHWLRFCHKGMGILWVQSSSLSFVHLVSSLRWD